MIGNDIVDLSDPESSRDACHSRFDRRVFRPEEGRLLSMDHSDVQIRWILWSAKEAAYKAARRVSAGVVFSPARFVVDLDRSLCGSVWCGTRRWPVRVRVDGDCVHAVVSGDETSAGTLSGARRLTPTELRDPSEAVRRFALSSIAAELGVAISELRIEKVARIPQLVLSGSVGRVALSLSHHGAYVGFACRDPRIDGAARISQRAVVRKAARLHGAPHASISYPSHAVQGDLR